MRKGRWPTSLALVPGVAWLCLISFAQAADSREDSYIDSAVCGSCHPKQAETYQRTGMGRSFYRPDPSKQVENYSRGLPYYHEASATYYSMTVREGRYYQSQYQIGLDGKPENFSEKQIDYVIGSGNHARTYLSRTSRNTLIELPLAWYSEKGGYWAMNPGYDRPDHDGFTRPIEYNCMFCHNAYPALPADGRAAGESVFPVSLPEGIDCQRCHGPGRAHVAAARRGDTAILRTAIVNPARLTRARQIEVCLQCHLETTSAALPNSITRYERGPFSYRPGEPLANFRLDFDYSPAATHKETFEIAGAAYQLEQSACLLGSGGKLSCTTCHDPHEISHGVESDRGYDAVCSGCHQARLDRLIASSRHTASNDCIGCHMPKRRTDDAVHVVMTDHRIRRFKAAADLPGDLPERSPAAYRGPVVLYARPSSTWTTGQRPNAAGDELYLAIAQVSQDSNLSAGIPRLAAAIKRLQPKAAEYYTALADAWRDSGQCGKAIPIYEEALRHRPGDAPILQKTALCFTSTGQYEKAEQALRDALSTAPDDSRLWAQFGLSLLGQDNRREAVAALEKATAIDPDLSEAWNNLGEIRFQLGDAPGAESALRSALRAKPNSAAAHSNLGNLFSAENRFEESKYQFESALHYQPGDASIHLSYGRALARARRYADATTQFEKGLHEDPNNAELHHSLGLVFDSQGDPTRAIQEYREAVRLRPSYPLANLSLGFALMRSGKMTEAIPYLNVAAGSPEAPVRERARMLLNQYIKP